MIHNATKGWDPAFRGAVKRIPRPPPPPPPRPFCSTPLANWPKFGAATDGDVGLRLDVCNISAQREMKVDRCEFWHSVVDQYWEAEKWIPASQPKVRAQLSQMAAARVAE